jgi:hypothetical protein
MDINIAKNITIIMPSVEFWWMDEKWCQHDVMVAIIGELHNK